MNPRKLSAGSVGPCDVRKWLSVAAALLALTVVLAVPAAAITLDRHGTHPYGCFHTLTSATWDSSGKTRDYTFSGYCMVEDKGDMTFTVQAHTQKVDKPGITDWQTTEKLDMFFPWAPGIPFTTYGHIDCYEDPFLVGAPLCPQDKAWYVEPPEVLNYLGAWPYFPVFHNQVPPNSVKVLPPPPPLPPCYAGLDPEIVQPTDLETIAAPATYFILELKACVDPSVKAFGKNDYIEMEYWRLTLTGWGAPYGETEFWSKFPLKVPLKGLLWTYFTEGVYQVRARSSALAPWTNFRLFIIGLPLSDPALVQKLLSEIGKEKSLWKNTQGLRFHLPSSPRAPALDRLADRLRTLKACAECPELLRDVEGLQGRLKTGVVDEAFLRDVKHLSRQVDRLEARPPKVAAIPPPRGPALDEAARALATLAQRLTPLQQDREAQLLLREVQALHRELAAGPEAGQVQGLLRDAQRLGRETDRLEASLRRQQQQAAAAGPAPSAPAAPPPAEQAAGPGPQPGQPAGPPQVAAVLRPALPARDPVAEEAAKELKTLARRLTALGANSDAQRLLREVQLLQQQLGGEPGQAPAILRKAKRLTGEVDRLEASLRQRVVPPSGPAPPQIK